ncbi:hypothetical protein PI126_g16881 [Phytophthora idaei]|nr:hypothetical protein PI126_g16881 [Phytophthora idaei]
MLLYSATYGKIDIVEYLIEQLGVEVNSKNKDGCTALSVAAACGKIEVVLNLDVNVKNVIDENCYLTLDEVVDALEARFEVKVSRQTIKHHIDGRLYTIKKAHRDSNYHNLPENKILRRDYITDLLAFKTEVEVTD